MAAALRNRLQGLGLRRAPASPLEVELKRATQAASIVAPEDAIAAVVKASNDVDDRRTIMRHLNSCLSQQASAQWRSVYLAMLVLEELLKSGSPELVTETANGVHFDLVQRLSFLVNYEYSFDERVQGLMRKKAKSIRDSWHQRQLASMVELCDADAAEGRKASKPQPPAPPARRPADDDSDDEDYLRGPAVVYRRPAPAKAAAAVDFLDMQDDSTNDGSDSTSGASADPSPHPEARTTVDLLSMDDGPASAAAPAVASEAAAAPAPPAAPASPAVPEPSAPEPAAQVDWLNAAKHMGLFSEQAYAEDLCAKGAPPAGAAPAVAASGDLLDF